MLQPCSCPLTGTRRWERTSCSRHSQLCDDSVLRPPLRYSPTVQNTLASGHQTHIRQVILQYPRISCHILHDSKGCKVPVESQWPQTSLTGFPHRWQRSEKHQRPGGAVNCRNAFSTGEKPSRPMHQECKQLLARERERVMLEILEYLEILWALAMLSESGTYLINHFGILCTV